jgi:hypothetical protein
MIETLCVARLPLPAMCEPLDAGCTAPHALVNRNLGILSCGVGAWRRPEKLAEASYEKHVAHPSAR